MSICILHLEDNEIDARVVLAKLLAGLPGLAVTLVKNRQEYETAIGRAGFDLILSDYNLPDCDGLAALEWAKACAPGVPFIVVSGSIGEESAVDVLRGGATDYVSKERLDRLVPAVRRALEALEVQRAREKAESELARATQTLREEKLFTSALLENLSEGVVACDSNGKLILFNRVAREWHGLEARPLPPERWAEVYDLYVPDGKTPLATDEIPLFRAFRGEHVRDVGMSIVVKGRPPRHVVASGYPLHDKDDRKLGAVAVMHDITAQRTAEEEKNRFQAQFQQAQKMEAVGRLAGGVAHDFNNMLMAIMSFSDLAPMSLPESHPARAHLNEVQSVADRAAGLTRQLLAFSRRQAIEQQVIDLNGLIVNIEKMLRRLIGAEVELRTKLSQPLGRIKVDPGQIEQVIMNLVINARDAMPDGGVLTVETDDVDLDEPYVQARVDVRAGPYVRLAVNDTGIGMTEEVRARIFEPFFTTKEQGKGTGLGLATCFGIVKQHGGNIEVYSEVGRGTSFKIYIPRIEDVPGAPARTAAPRKLAQRNETILVVDDEAQVRAALAGILEAHGYTVLEAGNGDEALRVSETQGKKKIHLVLTDIAMPGMDGRELCKRLKSSRPDVKVILMSGYVPGAMETVTGDVPPAAVVQKPLRSADLGRKVREVLDGK